MSDLERLALGVLLPSFHGVDVPDWIRRGIDDGLGGVVLFADNLPLTGVREDDELDGILVAIDEEGGDVTRLGVPSPGNLALGVLDDVALTEEVAGEIARECLSAGVNVNLAPVADVNVDDQNAAISVRSFGADVDLVARHTASYIRGTQREGVAACAKHFPGHGHTREDSHKELPTLDLDLAEPLRPFVAAIEAGVAAIMTAHICVPALDDVPATLSRALHDLLRGELGFEGVVITDALEMGACSNAFGPEEASVRALAAGADALCLGSSYGEREVASIRKAIVDAVRRGEVPEDRLAEATGRVEDLASRFPVRRGRPRPQGDIGRKAARLALRIEGDPRLAEPATVVEFRPDPLVAAGEQRFGLGDALRARGSSVEVVRAERSGAAPLGPPEQLLVLVLRDAHRHPWQRAAAEELLARRPDAVVVETGLPVWRPPHSGAYVVTHGAGRVNLEAAADVLAPVREPALAKEA